MFNICFWLVLVFICLFVCLFLGMCLYLNIEVFVFPSAGLKIYYGDILWHDLLLKRQLGDLYAIVLLLSSCYLYEG